ncbi:hypothetical protein DFJ73DRAFT_621053 [Zopfochytrium polystomum]|nr:hypothetical protein DFJ73DRAFT_621053 [Zopfochytrium polystomum]
MASVLLLDLCCCPRCIVRLLGVAHRPTHRALAHTSRASLLSLLPGGLHGPAASAAAASSAKSPPSLSSLLPAALNLSYWAHPSPHPPPPSVDATAVAAVSTTSTTTTPTTSSSNAASADPICPTCLGLLQRPLRPIAEAAQRQLAESRYAGATSVVVCVRVPPQLALRQWAALRCVEHRLAAAGIPYRAPGFVERTVDVKDVLKTLLTEEFREVLGLPFEASSQLQFEVGFDHAETENDYMFMTSIGRLDFKVKKKKQRDGKIAAQGNSWNKVLKASSELTQEELVRAKKIPLPIPKQHCTLAEFKFWHDPVYFAGRYNKLQRGVSHSRWVHKGERLWEDSVEELIAPHLVELSGAESHKFSSAGREDVDVLMLGRGRPFYFELVNPKRAQFSAGEVAVAEARINAAAGGRVAVRDLQAMGDKESLRVMKDSAATKRKSYSTLVRLSEPVALDVLERVGRMTDIELKQQTPVRVAAAADLSASTSASSASSSSSSASSSSSSSRPKLSYRLIRVDLTTSAGTYVKEFVHGDGGRTTPSLRELVGVREAEVLALDVTDVALDWPPPVTRVQE